MKIKIITIICLILIENIFGSTESSEKTYQSLNSFDISDKEYEVSSSMDISSENSILLGLDYSQSYVENSDSSINNGLINNKLFNFFAFEDELKELILCEEDFCKSGLYRKNSKKKFKLYMKTIIKEYIINSKVHSWFYRLWSSSTVITTPILYIEKKAEFKELYEVVKKSYKKLRDSAVIIILKILTKGVPKELKKEEEEILMSEYSSSESSMSYKESSENSKENENSFKMKTSIPQAVKNLCIKLRTLSKHRNKDNNQSYIFVIEAYDITNKELLSNLMTRMIYTSCWNRSNINKSRIIIPFLIGNFKEVKSKGILSDIYSEKNKNNKKARKRKRSSNRNRSKKAKRNSSNISEFSKINKIDNNVNNNILDEINENNEENNLENNENNYNSLFIKWLKKCNESKILVEKYEKLTPGLFNRLLVQYLIYAINSKFVVKQLVENNKFLLDYPVDCQNSWNNLINIIESDSGETDYENKVRIINLIIDSLSTANNSLFKDEDQILKENNENEDLNKNIIDNELNTNENDENNNNLLSDKEFVSENKSKLTEPPEKSELLSIISNKDHISIDIKVAQVFDDLMTRLIELPDHRKSRIEFKNYLIDLVKIFKGNKSLNSELYQLFEAIDYVQNSFHVIRILFINNIDLGLTVNPLELLINTCKNAKLIPFNSNNDENVDTQELLNNNQDQNENECNPFLYLTEDLLNDEYDGDIMEPIQKSSIKYTSLLLRLSQYNLKTLNIHVSNLLIKVERLLLSNSLDINKIPNLILIIYEKIQTMPFNTLSSFSYLKEMKDTKIVSQLSPYTPLFTSYTLIGLYGEVILPENNYDISRILLMEICLIYYNPKTLLDDEFIKLCNLSWNYLKKEEFYNAVESAISNCKKISEKNDLGNNSQTIFLICYYLDKLKNGPSNNSNEFANISGKYIPKEFDDRCGNIKSYSIQQSNNLYLKLSEIFKSK